MQLNTWEIYRTAGRLWIGFRRGKIFFYYVIILFWFFFLNIYIYYLIVVAELEESRLREGKRNGSEMNLWNKVIRLLGVISRKWKVVVNRSSLCKPCPSGIETNFDIKANASRHGIKLLLDFSLRAGITRSLVVSYRG